VAREGEDVEGLDEEFQYHLSRGSDLLGRGNAEGALEPLERGLTLRPRDPKVLALLGQAHYRVGRFEAAAVAWRRLVDDNPAEAGARVNLGLALLKARTFPEAIRQLEIALDLNPDHRKAMGYLGLALLESGDALRAIWLPMENWPSTSWRRASRSAAKTCSTLSTYVSRVK
jgi:tetratricopeptide (TPR) repeat protein